MSSYALSEPAHDEEAHPRSGRTVAYIVLASIVSGLGLFLTLIWLITFTWVYLIGIVLMTIGFLLFFSPWAGPDKA